MKRTAFAWLLLATTSGSSVWGYVPIADEGGYVITMAPGTFTMVSKLPTPSAPLTDGSTTYTSVVQISMQAWNDVLGTVQFASQIQAPGSHGLGNGISEIVLDSTVDGQAFPNGALAVTINDGDGNTRKEVDVIFNTAYTWDSYRGALRPAQDFQRVAIHELGHVVGLDHPDESGQSVIALLNSHVSNVDALQADDIAGGQFLYGAPGFKPANDNFANAVSIVLSTSSIQLTGTNIAATKEAGEPDHAQDATGIRSVWWRWTAPSSGNAVLTTLGSNFDTMVGAYTGSSVSGLTSIAYNDDEEPYVPGVDDPLRKRTSKVTFAAVGGATYSIAVDGWDGNFGQIKLGISFDGSLVGIPIITTQPAGRAVPVGGTAGFTVAAAGGGSFAYQWRRNNAGLANGGKISGANTATLTISNVQMSDVGSYSVVVSNAVGSTTSVDATLSVVPARPAGFEVNVYLAFNPDLQALFGSLPDKADYAWAHLWLYGLEEGRVFDDEFRVDEYLALNDDLRTFFGTDRHAALLHWLTYGKVEGRLGRIPTGFSAEGYLARNPDLAVVFGTNYGGAWLHFWAYGIYEGRAYDDEFRVFEYLALNPDLQPLFLYDWRGALMHWLRYGRTEGRLGRVPLIFDSNEYLARNPDVAAAWGTYPTTVWQHFWYYGVYEGRNIDDEFRVDEYLAMYPDLQALFGTDRRAAFMHWVRYGRDEGRLGRFP